MFVTIKEIAKMANVHRSTVDKVIHKRVGVSDKVRERVQKIIDDLAYEPNPLGKALKRQNKKLVIAAVLVKVDALDQIRAGIERAFRTYQGLNIEVQFYVTKFPDVSGQTAILMDLVGARVDGIILSPINAPQVKSAIDRAMNAGIAVVTTNQDIDDSARLCFVGQDGTKAGQVAGRLMGEFLGGKGRIAVITAKRDQDDHLSVDKRERGFLHLILQEYPGLEVVENIESLEDENLIYQRTLGLLAARSDLNGIYITCGGVREVGRALKEAQRAHVVKVICFERYPEIVALMQEGVITCTIDSDLEEQGYRPCRLLIDYLLYDKKIKEKSMFTNISILVKENV
jgi:ABC-type sugar transport system substrate-binding protein